MENTKISKIVSCKYLIENGRFRFKKNIDAMNFIKLPQIEFDFRPENIDDKEGVKKIFRTIKFKPIHQKNSPKFTIRKISQDNIVKNVLIISAEVEISFKIKCELNELKKWIYLNKQSWNYTGRIICKGEDGLLDSDKEGYEFNWEFE